MRKQRTVVGHKPPDSTFPRDGREKPVFGGDSGQSQGPAQHKT